MSGMLTTVCVSVRREHHKSSSSSSSLLVVVVAAARMDELRNAYNILVGKPEGKNHLGDLGVDGRIISEWVLGKQEWKGVDKMHLVQDSGQW
jgi:hypothetical protein